MQTGYVFLLLTLLAAYAWGADKLQSYNVDPTQITVSGLSSGGAMATQFHFAHSSEISGVGIFAGIPYLCARGGLIAATSCMTLPGLTNVGNLISEANSLASSNQIDSTANIVGDKVYIFHGQVDTTVFPANGNSIQRMYEHYGANIKAEFSINAEHGQPTDNYGAVCNQKSGSYNYINNCNYKGAFTMLNHLYGGNLVEPDSSTVPSGDLILFDQSEFFNFAPSLSSMAATGYVYVPTACKSGAQCRVHVVYHGCQQNSAIAGDTFVRKAGYLEAAELNNIIVLFPQTVATPLNPNGCWDWWGYLNIYFPTKSGNQILATQRMLNRLKGA